MRNTHSWVAQLFSMGPRRSGRTYAMIQEVKTYLDKFAGEPYPGPYSVYTRPSTCTILVPDGNYAREVLVPMLDADGVNLAYVHFVYWRDEAGIRQDTTGPYFADHYTLEVIMRALLWEYEELADDSAPYKGWAEVAGPSFPAKERGRWE